MKTSGSYDNRRGRIKNNIYMLWSTKISNQINRGFSFHEPSVWRFQYLTHHFTGGIYWRNYGTLKSRTKVAV